MKFHDICWDSVLTPASHPATYTWLLYETESMVFNPMVDTSLGTACGGYTYELEYVSGPLVAPSLSSHLSISATPAIEGTISDLTWLGTSIIRIKCTNGIYDASPTARGVNGLFTDTVSDDINVIFENPCNASIINDDGGVVNIELSVPEESSSATLSFNGPTNSVSVTFGNGFDICGDLDYTLSVTNEFTDEYMVFNPVVASGSVDALGFDLESSVFAGIVIPYEIELVATLTDFPTAPSAVIPVTFYYRECFPFDFEFSFESLVIEVYAGDS